MPSFLKVSNTEKHFMFESLFCCCSYSFVLIWALPMLTGPWCVVWTDFELPIQVNLIPQFSKKLGPWTCATTTGNSLGLSKCLWVVDWILLPFVDLRSGSHGLIDLTPKIICLFVVRKGMDTCMWTSEDNLQKSVLSFHQMGPRDQTPFASRCLYLLSHPVRSHFICLFGKYILFIF